MTVMYGVLAAMPMMWGYAGYVLVSHPALRRRVCRGGCGSNSAADLSAPCTYCGH